MKTKRNLLQFGLPGFLLMQAFAVQLIAQTIPNPSFETPVVGAVGNYYSFQYNPTGAGWTFIGEAGIAANGSGFAYYNGGTPYGNQFAFLQNYQGVGGSMSQTISNFVAGVYTFTFMASQRDIAGRDNTQNQGVTVAVDGTNVGSFTPASTNWVACQTAPVLLNAGNHFLTFTTLVTEATIRVDTVGVAIQAATTATKIATGGGTSLFLKSDSSLWAMGMGSYLRFGTNPE